MRNLRQKVEALETRCAKARARAGSVPEDAKVTESVEVIEALIAVWRIEKESR